MVSMLLEILLYLGFLCYTVKQQSRLFNVEFCSKFFLSYALHMH